MVYPVVYCKLHYFCCLNLDLRIFCSIKDSIIYLLKGIYVFTGF